VAEGVRKVVQLSIPDGVKRLGGQILDIAEAQMEAK
jgi:hypothetical protein